jgi:hypothetical protein
MDWIGDGKEWQGTSGLGKDYIESCLLLGYRFSLSFARAWPLGPRKPEQVALHYNYSSVLHHAFVLRSCPLCILSAELYRSILAQRNFSHMITCHFSSTTNFSWARHGVNIPARRYTYTFP